MKNLLLCLLAASLTVFLGFKTRVGNVPRTHKDSTPKYQYFHSSQRVETPTLYSSYDSVVLILNQLGRTLSVDEAANIKQIALRNLIKVYGSFKPDSVKVK